MSEITDPKRAAHDERFKGYRPPNVATIPKYQKIQEVIKIAADVIYEQCPDSVEKSKALTDLFNVRMWANAAVAIHTTLPTSSEEAAFISGV